MGSTDMVGKVAESEKEELEKEEPGTVPGSYDC